MQYTKKSLGCFQSIVIADGRFGHTHLRRCLAGLLNRLFATGEDNAPWMSRDMQPIYDSLLGEMPDDAWDENEALDLLNELACDESVFFEFSDGDLVLSEQESE